MPKSRFVAIFAVLATFLLFLAPLAHATPLDALSRFTPGQEVGTAIANDGTVTVKQSHRLIVELKSPALAVWSAQTGQSRTSEGRLDVRSAEAQAYRAQLQAEQASFIRTMESALPSASVASYLNESGQEIQATYQVVLNAVAIDPGSTSTAAAMKILSGLDNVKAVYPDYAHQPDLYASLPLINAAALWNNAAIGGQGDAGAGVKVASMDGGLHHDAPMFSGEGYSYPPGWPAGGLGDPENNNGKIIASRAYFRTWDPPAPGDENTWPGVAGTSHGVHTGSTAMGNIVDDATYLGTELPELSGVAPAAWAMSYRVFYESVTSDGSFYTVEGIAALEDIVMDGADVVNNSWGGGPGSAGGPFDPLDTALINASNAGVFVSMSAGNAGPGSGTSDHPSADYIVVAASTTTGTYAAGNLDVTAPEPISPTLQDLPFGTASFGAPLDFGQQLIYEYLPALVVDPGNVTGCAPWSGTPFTGKAALISRGDCTFGNKVYYAQQAGAEFVVIYDNQPGPAAGMSCGGDFCGVGVITIASVRVALDSGQGMLDWYAEYGDESAFTLDLIAYFVGNTADVIASFSSRGPGVGNVLKPDIAAPGVNIMAQGYDSAVTGEARHLGYGQVSGTSMASPHVAGAAALLKQARPEWSNAMIKSALMSTSKYMDIYTADGAPAQPLDMGAGRLDLTNAADPGVILDPPSLSFGLVQTGSTAMLHVVVTSVADSEQTYDVSTLYTGDGFTMTSDVAGLTVSPAQITLAPGESMTLTAEFDSSMGHGLGDNQGYVILDGDSYDAHMPAWARVTALPADAEVLLVDADLSDVGLGLPDYSMYYMEALDELGVSYDYWDTSALCCVPNYLPQAAELLAYDKIVLFTGDNFYADGSFTVPTPLTDADMERLTEYANGGGKIVVMGQDASGVFNDSFFDDSVLGDEQLQDSVSGFNLPDAPIVALADAPPAYEDIYLDLSGAETTTFDLSGLYEVPPVMTENSGEATVSFNALDNVFSYQITVNAAETMSITNAHIHTGTAGVSGGVLAPIWPFTETQVVTQSLSWGGEVMVTEDWVDALLSEGTYFNVHTVAYPGGELRGQIEVTASGDGAGNQFFVDEMATVPNEEPIPASFYPYVPLLRYTDPTFALEDGVVTMAHRDQPTLERPGISFMGRIIYASFGLEGVNNAAMRGPGMSTRADLLHHFLTWTDDEPTVTIAESSGDNDAYALFEAEVSSNVGATGWLYRWDYGDGTEVVGPYSAATTSYNYQSCGTYMVHVEATDSWGNKALASTEITVSEGCVPPTALTTSGFDANTGAGTLPWLGLGLTLAAMAGLAVRRRRR